MLFQEISQIANKLNSYLGIVLENSFGLSVV